ncbi:ABC transporter ATP-binding protein [Myxococcus sp. MISCRS1]|jgi:putative ABC transport system ATP-binding protein|uniref:ABC transport system ATP-binding protein n=1 Tax=Myxococcus fulvus TaxID=33 RepID=A0A511SY53_MYXFU|nr:MULTISPECIES: ABC transporter ATP-binding protein [Myxococcus]BDT37937.1 ABC transporter ATP-binding protein [Myxococcus sp. MH1]MBZ4396428.1 ABC transporter ATP-binding protein [Myxococcus sp. AS-1-15]MBZ4411867.1 ABC transporter ATP-binding protein [Myxococcus sp. XM-1-1-1]MCK8500698.1 ABC transporter ATP-binding protein [Myxococcus fulvus]MCY1000517.1 ABC transporter ATP-binding protein [Myxococcus sp. MISCRS1]
MSDTPPVVELRDVTKSYVEGDTAREVLSGVSLSLWRGEFVVLLGRSGSGKSTLLNLISGIDLPTRGEVHVDGKNLGALSERERTLLRRERVGFIFQAFNLLPTLTVEENVRLPVELNGSDAAKAGARARELLEQVGLANRGGSFPDRLSGGEQQRVAVARALAHAPPLLLADEPTGNLDEATGRQVLDLLEGLTRRGQACALVVTHEPGLVARADRVLEMVGGRLVEREAHRKERP